MGSHVLRTGLCSRQVRVSGHVLADGADGGDTPETPVELASAPLSAGSTQHPAVLLVEAVLAQLSHGIRLICACEDPRVGPLAPFLSPLVAEALLWFVGRVAHTWPRVFSVPCAR